MPKSKKPAKKPAKKMEGMSLEQKMKAYKKR